jgi:protein-glutamine gamma-glutamyltransferase
MINIGGRPFDTAALLTEYAGDGIERSILNKMASGGDTYEYDTVDELKFELRMRREIIRAAKELDRSGLAFEVFRDSRVNPDYWIRRGDGGFELKRGVKPSAAIRDIFQNGSEYGTECATAIPIVYYKALLEIFPEDDFNRLFGGIHLMNWHRMSPELRSAGMMRPARDRLPGDRLYFANPDVDPRTPEWQGENVIDLGDGRYYGHGIGIRRGEMIIAALNENRRPGAGREAYLMDSAGRPDFKLLDRLYQRAVSSVADSRQTA